MQLALNGVMSGTVLAIAAIGFNIIFAVLRFSNFSLAAHLTLGAYAGWVLNAVLGVAVIPSVLGAFVAAGLAGVASDFIALRPLRGSGPVSVAIASLALNMVIENVVRFAFGNDVRSLDVPVERDWTIGQLHVGPQQAEECAVALGTMALLFALLAFTRMGRAMRAVADNPRLADSKGIDPESVSRLAVFIGMGCAGVAGVLIALDSSVDPLMGMGVILPVFAASVLGGLGSIPGAVIGGLAIGVAEELSSLLMPTAYRSAVGFFAIILTLLFFPRGLLGQR